VGKTPLKVLLTSNYLRNRWDLNPMAMIFYGQILSQMVDFPAFSIR
jgi:hypothetical protein